MTFRTGSIRNATTPLHDDIALKDHIRNHVRCRRALRSATGESHGGDHQTAVRRQCENYRGNVNRITPFRRPANLRGNHARTAGLLVRAVIPKSASGREDSSVLISIDRDDRDARQHQYANDASISTGIVKLLKPETDHEIRTLPPGFAAFVSGEIIKDPIHK